MIRTLEKPLPLSSRDDARWKAVVSRDASFEGQFYIAVKTTGIYCRPGCPARLPKRANVRFFDTRDEAERAGFRPCKRCKPDQPPLGELHAGKIAQACRLIETADEAPKLDALAEAVGLSPYHFHRIFKQAVGVTPKAYADAHRNKRVRAGLPVAGRVISPGWHEVGTFLGPSIRELHARLPIPEQVELWRSAGIEDVRVRRLSLGGGYVVWGRRGG
jgi:AraC family transcriptional regulator of adaptative response/methylated-DNA-[protein]-cysteine methyltransferase